VSKRFTEMYLDYAKEFTDCPDIFLHWGALLSISSVLSRFVYFKSGRWNPVPNLWIILIGKSSSHKSTAIGIAEDLVEGIDAQRLAPHEFTQEAIIKALSENASRMFIFDEAKSFFDSTMKDYNKGLSALLTTLYRKPNYTRTTMKHGTISIQNAYLTMGMATTPEWLRKSLQNAEETALSGFLSRFLLVLYSGEGNTPYPISPPEDMMKFGFLKDRLREFRELEHQFDYEPDALIAFDVWFKDLTDRENRTLPIFGAFYEHFKNEAIHKLSMLYAIDRGETTITRPAFGEAVNALTYIEEMLPSLVEDLTSDVWERERRKIRDYIKSKAICTRESLADNVHIHGEKLTRHLTGLKADSLIVLSERKTKTKPITMLEWVGGMNERNGDG
jgi:hypothetical protein